MVLLGQAQRNDELNLQLRTQAGAGLVHPFVQSNSGGVVAFGGATFSNEVFTDDTPSTRTWELVFGMLDSYDSDPPSADARHHDLAVITSIGWTL